jgi:DNA repair exonuclease SbcCD ATPase subunit
LKKIKKEHEEELEKEKEKIKKLQVVEEKKIDNIDDQQKKIREEEERKNKERAKIRESKSFRDVCDEIDTRYKALKEAKRVWDEHLEYLRNRSGAGTFFKGVFSLGIHSLDNWGKAERLENNYKDIKEELKKSLYTYRGMMLQEKHSLHDEVFL